MFTKLLNICVAIFEYFIGKIIIPSCCLMITYVLRGVGWGEVACVGVHACVHVHVNA